MLIIKLRSLLPLFLFVLLCIGSMFVNSQSFTDTCIVPKWIFTMVVVLLMSLYCSIVGIVSYKPMKISFAFCGRSISVICLVQAIYGIIQYFGLLSSHSTYKVVGSFDNPAGFAACLCIGLPFVGCFMLENRSKWFKCIGWIIGVVIAVAVVLSYSRAGIISIVVLGGIFLYKKVFRKPFVRVLLLIGLTVMMVGCYWMKKDSADGRLLIWQCGLNMGKEALWLGHGIGSFEAHYMDYQADYFSLHNQSRFSMLADNVKQPFNEYLGVFLNFGIVGLLLLLIAIGGVVYCYMKRPTLQRKIALYSLISIGVFSCFSYPFTYPFVWILVFLSVFVIIGEYFNSLLSIVWLRYIILVSVCLCSLAGLYKVNERFQAEKDWCKATELVMTNKNEIILSQYKCIERKMSNDPYFLYNYAAALQELKQYDQSLEVALQCRQYWADYDLELIIGENYQRLDKPEFAEIYYNSASLMCPSRFLPLYKLFHLYKENDKRKRALEIAGIIINKPVKIKTPSVRMMKREMEREMLAGDIDH